MATRKWVILEMPLEHQAQWNAEQGLQWETMMAQWEPMAAQWKQWSAKCAECTKRHTTGLKRNIYKIVDPVRYCGSAKELDHFLYPLCSNFNSDGHLFPCGGPDRVKDAISLLDALSNYQKLALSEMVMRDISEWPGNLPMDSDRCLQAFDLYSQEMVKVYGAKNKCRMAVIRVVQEYILLP